MSEQPEQPGQPGSPPPPPTPYGQPGIPPPIGPASATASLVGQFRGNAGWSLILGVVTIAVPLIFNHILFFLPIVGLIAGILAIRRGQLIGGIVGLVLNAIGGLITVLGLVYG
jgi:hypothetical protein